MINKINIHKIWAKLRIWEYFHVFILKKNKWLNVYYHWTIIYIPDILKEIKVYR